MTEWSWFENYGTNNISNFDLDTLAMDQAFLLVNILNSSISYQLLRKNSECYECPFQKMIELDNDSKLENGTSLILDNVPRNIYRLATNNSLIFCEFGTEIEEFGIYTLEISKSCKIRTIKNSVSIFSPVLTIFLIYLGISLLILAIILIWEKIHKKEEKKNEKIRIKSLDTFRGITIMVMIFVNYGAGGYKILDHAPWNGLHLADLVFPCFMWIMGVCIPVSLLSSLKKQTPRRVIFGNVLKRSLKLFCLGVFIGSGSNLECLRIFGVLQRFGICYFVVTLICLFFTKQEIDKKEDKFGKYFIDIFHLRKAWVVVLLILGVHSGVLYFVTEGNCPRGYLGPGGLHKNGEFFNCTGGATGYIDRYILGKHMYKHPTSEDIYKSQQFFDPEGILGCLTSIIQVFIGVQGGFILLIYKNHAGRITRWLIWSILTGVIGGILSGFSKEDGLIPVNKNLWSISFVLVTSSLAFFLLAVCYVLIDANNIWSGKPFIFAGMNAILIYFGHEMTYGHFPIRWSLTCDKPHPTHFIALFENLWGTGFWLLVSYYLYKINYFFAL